MTDAAMGAQMCSAHGTISAGRTLPYVKFKISRIFDSDFELCTPPPAT
jgi:hypothetical protein